MLTHRLSGHPIHTAWMRMTQRCTNPNYEHYHRYGGRGIRICDRWKSFDNFYVDVKDTWKPELSLDRYPYPDGDYEPSNFRWATRVEQCNNRSTNVFITYRGVTKTVVEWSAESGIKRQTLAYRLAAGWTPEEIFNRPVAILGEPTTEEIAKARDEGMSIRKTAKHLGISRQTVLNHLKKFREQ
jgi:lambda repressor-like predicted transcriptional regulator